MTSVGVAHRHFALGSPTRDDTVSARMAAVLLLVIVVLTIALRWRLLDIPLERDEGELAYMAQLMLDGVPPYAQAYNMKLPGVYAVFAVILAVFGQTHVAVHLGLVVINVATILLLYLIAARLFDRRVGVIAAGVFALLSISPYVLGFAANAEHFVIAFALAGVALLLDAIERDTPGRFLTSGIVFGLAVLMKQQGYAFALFGGLYVVAAALDRRQAWRRVVLSCVALGVGVLLPLAATLIALWRAGVLARFWFWNVTYVRHYSTMIDLWGGLLLLREAGGELVTSALGMWSLVAVGVTAMIWDWLTRRRAPFLALFACCSSLATSAGLLFRSHYFLLVLPAAALFVGVGVDAMRRQLGHVMPARFASMAASAVLLLAAGVALFARRDYLFQYDPILNARYAYGDNPFPEALEIARVLRARTTPTERIAVVGSEPEIYFYAHRHGATGYIYTYALMEPQPYAEEMQREMIREIETAQPRFIVGVDVARSWLVRPESPRLIFEWLDQYLAAHYELIGVADIKPEVTEMHWDANARAYQIESASRVLTYERRTGPPPA